MPDAVSALDGAAFEGFARVEEAGPCGMIALRGDLSSTALRTAATDIAGTGFPERRKAQFADGKGICWMSLDEVLVLCPYREAAAAAAKIEKALHGTHHLAANVSDSRTLFFVSGAESREAIAKLSPADLSPAAFRPGQFRRTRLAQTPAAFWMRDDLTVGVIVFRSVAQYAFDALKKAAAPGSEAGFFR